MTNPTMVLTMTLTRSGIMKEWLSRYLPMTVVPERSKFTVAMSDGGLPGFMPKPNTKMARPMPEMAPNAKLP